MQTICILIIEKIKKKKQDYDKEYRKNNRDRIAELRNKNNKKYAKNNTYVIRHKIQSQLSSLCGKKGSFKNAKYKDIDLEMCVKALIKDAELKGYSSIKEIKKSYHIDHIIPISYYTLDEFVKGYHPKNLRWLPISENCSRGNKIRPQDLEIIKTLPKEIYPKGMTF